MTVDQETIADFAKGYPLTHQKKDTFNPFINTEYVVEDISLQDCQTGRRSVYVLPGEITPHNVQELRQTSAQRAQIKNLGKTTKLTKSQFLCVLLLRNEVMGCVGKAVDPQALKKAYRREFGETKTRYATRYFDQISRNRYAFNKATLFKDQTFPPLYCWKWSVEGYICDPRTSRRLLSFDQCLKELKSHKFADPRFFPLTFLETIRYNKAHGLSKYSGWHAPSLEEVHRIEAQIKKPLFDSIEFPDGLKRKSSS